ncbi:MAG: site-2 protease family protein [Spirochaetia bacterium]|nr:site-2 protease family protein [Spirochaetia bacterium]
MENFNILEMMKVLPAVILGLTVHEYAHAYTAYKLGDSTAKDMGRMTFNPVKHIDPLGFFFILIAGFGWAKPVIINPDNLKNKHRDEIWISVAGPLSNLILGIALFVLARLLFSLNIFTSNLQREGIIQWILLGGVLNFGLFIFNLIPIPPLDGSHIYLTYLKKKNEKMFQYIYKYGSFALFGIIIFENQSKIQILPISSLIHFISNFFFDILQFK